MSKNYNTALQTNNSSLEELIVQLNNLPSADEGGLDTSDATATSGDILNGKTAYVNGEKITGNIAFQPAQTITPGTTNQTIASGKYLEGAITIKGDANLIAGNIVSGKSIFGVVGTATAGGGGGDTSMEDGLITGTLTTYTNDRVTNIRKYAFQYCSSLASVSFQKVTTIGSYAFYACSGLTNVSFPEVTTIQPYAFAGGNSLTSITFPKAINLQVGTFVACSKLTSIYFPQLTNTGNSTFCNCSKLTNISLPEVTVIGRNVFEGCTGLTYVSFPKVTNIASNAFRSCSSLISANFPVLTYVGSSAFQGCTSLISIYLGASTVCTLANTTAFTNAGITSTTGSIFVPASLLASYQAATNWAYFSNRIFSYAF